MSIELEGERKVNYGVWTALEFLINKGNSGSIWDKSESQPKPVATRKKEKNKIRKFLTPILKHVKPDGNELSRPSPLRNSKFPQDIFSLLSKVQTVTKAKVDESNDHTKEVNFNRIDAENEKKRKKKSKIKYTCPTVQLPLIECSINLPRVNAQLERLMGSNVVHLTDRKYMMELRQRIHEDFNNMLIKRIQAREAGEMQRQRVLLMEGKLTKCPKELRNHPAFTLNDTKKKFVVKRRGKLKTNRERVAERLLRLGKKWEAEHKISVEQERQREAEMKIKELEVLTSDTGKIDREISSKKKSFNRKGGMDLQNFLKNENVLMLDRLKPKEKKFKPFTKDLRIVDAKRRLSEASIPKIRLLISKLANKFGQTTVQSCDTNVTSDDKTTDCETDDEPLPKNLLKKDCDNLRRVYLNPMIAELKQTHNVRDMYALAEKIVGNNIDKYLFDTNKSIEAEEAAT